ncbi:6-carboxytetrahydropterin synthase QueD [Paenibacillus sp. FSL R7-0297]|uniref:6-carboxytetrahydropterin synthase QueD n=1 Tax=unclassified Paenibacillus TaxID=185978 RepID=UPI0004F8EBC4|nr:6-carboxytetrahydropterin synthase QueD [Paenibacillus sp. FSL R5-0912]AIQ41780.1 6-pyruvoyl tetrahydrobiopterin synthase [Paenibacillus sp. FSL R5-0912]
MLGEISVCKIFTFDAAHQLIGHKGKCSNLHGHTYKLEVVLKGVPSVAQGQSDEGFVVDFSDIKTIVKQLVVDRLDHAFLAMGNEPVLETLTSTGSKVALLSFRTTAENMSAYIAYELKQASLPVYSVKLWETPTSWAEVLAADIPEAGPSYRLYGGCDHE